MSQHDVACMRAFLQRAASIKRFNVESQIIQSIIKQLVYQCKPGHVVPEAGVCAAIQQHSGFIASRFAHFTAACTVDSIAAGSISKVETLP